MGEDFLEKYGVDGTSELQEGATYHGHDIQGLLSFPSYMPSIRDLLASLKAGDHLPIYTFGSVLWSEQHGSSLLKRWQPWGSRLP